jgi:phage tail-like protein
MTANFDLWKWFSTLYEPGKAGLRGTTKVVVFAADGQTERVRFVLGGCLPVKLKAPPLNAKEGMVGIEELQIAYETLQLVPPS